MNADMPKQTRVSVPGGELLCRVGGQGPPVVLLHPPGMDSRLWLGQFSALMAEHLVIAPDQRGHGGSTPPASSYDPVVDAASVMATLGVRAAAIVGLDEAVEHAVRLACAHPELVFALVLVAPVLKVFVREEPDFYERGQHAAFTVLHDEEFAPLLSSIATGDMEALADWAMDRSGEGYLSEGHPSRGLVRAMIKDNAPAAVDELSRFPEGLRKSFGTPGECTACLAEVRAPTLIVANADERVAKDTDVLRGAIPGARTVTFDTHSMLLNMEREADFNETLREFLAQHRPPPSEGSG